MATKHLPSIRIGDDYTLRIAYPVGTDITGFKFYLTLKKSFDDSDADAIFQSSYIAGTNVLDDAEIGVCFFKVPASKTMTIPKGNYYYDFQAISAIGEVTTLAPPIDDYRKKLSVISTITLALS
jgi:hypothetical protein